MLSSMSLPGVRMITDSGSPSRISCNGSSAATSSSASPYRPAVQRPIRTRRDDARDMTPMLGVQRRDERVEVGRRVDVVELARRDAGPDELALVGVDDVERREPF